MQKSFRGQKRLRADIDGREIPVLNRVDFLVERSIQKR